MEVNDVYFKSLAQGEIQPLVSRVSNFSINKEIDSQNSNTRPILSQQMAKFEGRGNELRHISEESDETRGFMRCEMAETEECDALRLYTRKVNDENSGYGGQQMDRPEECDPKLSQHTKLEEEEKRGLMNQQMTKIEECDTKLLSQNKWVGNDDNLEECYAELPQCTIREDDEKRGFMSQDTQQMAKTEDCVTKFPQHSRGENDKKSGFVGQHMDSGCDVNLPQCVGEESNGKIESNTCPQNRGKYFYYDPPLCEETGVWIPVSVPPMSESEHEEWTRGFCSNGGIFPEGDMGWRHCFGEDKELTMWDVVVELLLAARGKVSAFASGDIHKISWISSHLIDQAWKEMAQTLTEANFSNTQEILETEPPRWLPDSAASTCMLCSVRFHPIMCTRHHCRFCGGVFCSECTKGRSLLPAQFRVGDPQRVCDVCFVRLESVQPYLMDQVSRAAQLPTHDLTDLSTLRSWLNFPWGQSMEYEIYKATNTIRGFEKVGSLRPEKSIPVAILRQAKGLAILTIMKVGMMVTYNIGTGLVVARKEDGSWSPPSAISSFGVGWGAQAGGEVTDLIIVLRSNDAVRTFSSEMHLSVGAGLSAAVGIVGRTAEADVRAGTGGYAACYTYSCSKGAFVGCSLEGSIVTTRTRENSRFYGSQSINASDILLGSMPRPPAAAILYRALTDIYQKLEV